MDEPGSDNSRHSASGPSKGLFAQKTVSADGQEPSTPVTQQRKNEVIHRTKREKASFEEIIDNSIPAESLVKMFPMSHVDCTVSRVVEPFYLNREEIARFCEFSGLCRDSAVEDFAQANPEKCKCVVCPDSFDYSQREAVDYNVQTGCQPYCDLDFKGSGKHYEDFSDKPIIQPISKPERLPVSLFAAEFKFDNLRIIPPANEKEVRQSGKTTIQLDANLTAESSTILQSLAPLMSSLGCSLEDLERGNCKVDLNSLISKLSELLATKCFECNLCGNQDDACQPQIEPTFDNHNFSNRMQYKSPGISIRLRENTTDAFENRNQQSSVGDIVCLSTRTPQ